MNRHPTPTHIDTLLMSRHPTPAHIDTLLMNRHPTPTHIDTLLMNRHPTPTHIDTLLMNRHPTPTHTLEFPFVLAPLSRRPTGQASTCASSLATCQHTCMPTPVPLLPPNAHRPQRTRTHRRHVADKKGARGNTDDCHDAGEVGCHHQVCLMGGVGRRAGVEGMWKVRSSCGGVRAVCQISLRLLRRSFPHFIPPPFIHPSSSTRASHDSHMMDEERQNRIGQHSQGQDSTEQHRTRQDRTGQDRTGQDRTGQDRTGQDKTGQDRTVQGRAGQDRKNKVEHDLHDRAERTVVYRKRESPGASDSLGPNKMLRRHLKSGAQQETAAAQNMQSNEIPRKSNLQERRIKRVGCWAMHRTHFCRTWCWMSHEWGDVDDAIVRALRAAP
eukprot:365775-Chlamydomonas_euryale.AAC.8